MKMTNEEIAVKLASMEVAPDDCFGLRKEVLSQLIGHIGELANNQVEYIAEAISYAENFGDNVNYARIALRESEEWQVGDMAALNALRKKVGMVDMAELARVAGSDWESLQP